MAQHFPSPALSIAAPCFNEEENIEAVVRDWADMFQRQNLTGQIVVCNDGSLDGTTGILNRLTGEFPFLVHVHNPVNGGYGHALGCAIRATTGQWVMTMDSDGQFDPDEYAKLKAVQESTGADCVTGCRMGKKDTFLRVIADRIMNLMVRVMFGLRLKDTNCAQKLVRGEVLRSLHLEAMGYPTPTEICVKVKEGGYSLAEVGVIHLDRTAGASKLKLFKTGWNALQFFMYLACKVRLYRKRVLNKL
ncbi:MAG: glycosyltransferase family 2 protein [Deltaproteobacteria bacterium]|nr:glycosyltransferase family 2 protein [Deltaproteobacteria bacterium]